MPDLSGLTASQALKDAQARLSGLLTPAVRIGVTGLARSGKTVFITALVRNLVTGGRLPFFTPDAEGRIVRAYLEPQPDDELPRFDYEDHLRELMSPSPTWPSSTRRISELRITIEYVTAHRWKRILGLSKVHLDIVDYPGEWLVDLQLLDQDYASFSVEALALATEPKREQYSRPWRDFVDKLDPAAREDETIALEGARLYTEYLTALRASGAQATLAPGRFLLPGDLAGSPLVTFFPMANANKEPPRGSLAAMLIRRYESYKAQVVAPFFMNHFKRLDRQIVLVDVLGALDQGSDAVVELERAMTSVMRAFRPGANTWLSMILGRKTDRILFAGTKADHLPSSSHDHLSAILKRVVETASKASSASGAGVEVMAISALRATRESKVKHAGEILPCLTGTPLSGERIGSEVFDGKQDAAIFPGDLPANPDEALDRARASKPGSLALVSFRPPRIHDTGDPGRPAALPHIRLDRALDYLIADYLS